MRAFFILTALATATPVMAGDLSLGLPITCDPGRNCWIQQYMDHDPSAGLQDYACGSQTYDGHDGTDIRIRDTTSQANVVAAAGGVVKATRDGVADRLVRTDADRKAIEKIECGNGVLIDHGSGWETQYCHMRQGSLAVRKGDRVEAGQMLGAVGYSGMAAFPHVHLSVRKDGKAVDPFRTSGDQSCGGAGDELWTDETANALPYQHSAIIAGGFAPGPVDLPNLEEGRGPAENVTPATDWPAAVAYVWAINLEAGDEIVVTFDGPDGLKAENRAKLDRAKAQYLLFSGKKRPPEGWPKGRYVARVEVRNDGAVRFERRWEATLN